MEKRKRHYDLAQIKMLIEEGAYRVTQSALKGAADDFGFIEVSQISDFVLRLSVEDFYKSMTTLHDVTLWQDVYRPMINGRSAYVKVQIVDETTVVISFKALEKE